jgi:hypothetical protein
VLGNEAHQITEYVRQPEGGTIHLYYRVADTRIALAIGSVRA